MDINKRSVRRRLKLGPFEFVADTVGSGVIDRWIIHCRGLGAVRLHRINKSDMDRDYHDHRFDFWSMILVRGYREHTPSGTRTFLPGQIVKHKAEDAHRLELLGGAAWTIQISGPQKRDWGFITKDGWVEAEHYDFYKRYGYLALQRFLRAIRKRGAIPVSKGGS